jgi:hypothetical protein
MHILRTTTQQDTSPGWQRDAIDVLLFAAMALAAMAVIILL